MITLAFAQMAYYITSGLSRYGGDDGLTIYKRSTFGGLIDLSNRVQFYYLCLGCLFGGIYLIWRIINSRFGMVVQGVRSNEQRMQAIGYHANRYRLVCFVISGTICGLAGALLANNTDFISPAGMYWTRSGELMVMVVFGGMGSLFGPVIGTIVFLAAGRGAVAVHRILGADHGPAVAADRAVRARRHHGLAGEVEPWLIPG